MKTLLTKKNLLLLSLGFISNIAIADVVHNDDVIVNNLCASDDSSCIDGEDFTGTNGMSAASIIIKDSVPTFRFRDTTTGESDWSIDIDRPTNESFSIYNEEGNSYPLIIKNLTGTNTLVLDSSRVGIGTDVPAVQLELKQAIPEIRLNDTQGGGEGKVDFRLNGRFFAIENEVDENVISIETYGGAAQADQVYLDSSGNVGLKGITNPTVPLHVGGNGTIRQNSGNAAESWQLNSNDDYVIQFDDGTTNHDVMRIENNDDWCTGAGGTETAPCVGFFDATDPAASVHIKKADGKTQLMVEEASGTTAVRQLIYLKNNGAAGFAMEDTSQSVVWDFRTTSTGNFLINEVGDGTEVTIMRNGNMIVQGSIVANGILLTSSRAAKTDFTKIKTEDVMQKLAKINIEEWRYKQADKNDRHISPMAEDFYSLFKLGPDNKHINPNDLASVAIIAAKELQTRNTSLKQKLNEETASLKAENESLKKRLASLEKLVTNLALGEGLLSKKGKQIVLK